MRLWHYKLLPVLPKSQLLSQWRELNSIYKKEPRHILINYIYTYYQNYKSELLIYSNYVIEAMKNRGYKINLDNYNEYFKDTPRIFNYSKKEPYNRIHNLTYLRYCVYNLREKYERGQKDFDVKTMRAINKVLTDENEKFLLNRTITLFYTFKKYGVEYEYEVKPSREDFVDFINEHKDDFINFIEKEMDITSLYDLIEYEWDDERFNDFLEERYEEEAWKEYKES